MNKSILSLIGTVDTLLYMLESDRAARNKPAVAAVRGRLERMRKTLLAEGLRHIGIVGAARDTVADIAGQLGAHLSAPGATRDVQWLMRTLGAEDVLATDPPSLPSSSSSSISTSVGRTRVAPAVGPAEPAFVARRARKTATSSRRVSGRTGIKPVTVTYPNGDKETA